MFSTRSRHTPSRGQALVRTDQLRAAHQVLQSARGLLQRAGQDGGALGDALARQRERLAQRAANVALAPVVTACELEELRQACRSVVALTGRLARSLGHVGQLS